MWASIVEWIVGTLASKLVSLFAKKEQENAQNTEEQNWADRPSDDADFARRMQSVKSEDHSP